MQSVTNDLIAAASAGDVERAQKLIGSGTDVNACTDYQVTPLIEAARMGHTRMMKFLLEKGSECERRRQEGRTALIVSMHLADSEPARLLLARGRTSASERMKEFSASSWRRVSGERTP